MKVFAIGDLHLDSVVDKPMDVFGPGWEDHFDRICKSWNEKVTQDDLVLKEMFGQILQRSIYEYLTVVKYDKNIESFGLTYEDIEGKIKCIEDKWVQNV